jgi:putative ABC transport system permease protein
MVMRAHAAWRKNQRREVWHTLGRFLAILAIVALGVGFFAGLKVTQHAMVDTGDAYIRACNLYDFELLTTLGIEDNEVEGVGALSGVRQAEGAYSVDFLAELDDGTSCVLVSHSVSDAINILSLTAGRMPEAPDECVADVRAFDADDIGRVISVSPENDADTLDSFATTEFMIVGLANSVTYLNLERGTTRLAGGKVDAYLYLPAGAYALDYYTELYVTLDNGGRIFSDAYDAAADAMEQPLTDELERLANRRYEDLVQDAQDEIRDAENEYNDGLDEYNEKKADADEELQNAWDELEDARDAIGTGWYNVNRASERLTEAQSEYNAGSSAYAQALSDYQSAKSSADAQFDASQRTIDTQRSSLNAALAAAQASGDAVQVAAIQAQLATLDAAQTALDNQRAAADAQFAATKSQLDAKKAELDTAAQSIASGQEKIESAKSDLRAAQRKYDDGLQEYEDKKAETEQELSDAEQELSDAKAKIDDAKAELADLQAPDCYVLSREDNIGYSCFENDSSIVNGIARVFPVFFFLVAALVCMTTMARMVEEQRTQIGTLKRSATATGAIAWKYISYSACAASVGCVLGFFGGIKLFPWVIWEAYGMLYGFAPILYVIDWDLFAVSLIVSLFCSAGVTYLTCRAEMTRLPAELMRPKTPKEGKRVLLERIPFLWNRMNFLKKVSMRNVFRYKKRLFMMMLGIGGCTALILAGLGMRDSIRNIASDQFEDIMKYDFGIVFDEAKDDNARAQFTADTGGVLTKCVFVCTDTLEAPSSEGVKTANVIATGDPAVPDLIDFHLAGARVEYPPDGSVVVSDQLARVARVTVGDTITVNLSDGRSMALPVSGVFENHVYHYMLMTPETYEQVFQKDCAYKAALATSAESDVHAVSAELIGDYGAANVSVTADIRARVSNMMISLDYIVIVVIACAAALAFVVLFNLSNINITERVREIATIKVLGFYAPEVGAYVFRENFVLTVFGALLGLPLAFGCTAS